MPMAVPRPVTLDDVTYVFEPGRKCRSDMGVRHCGTYRKHWWVHFADRHNVRRYYVDMQDPVTVRIRICDCPDCSHPALDVDGFRDAFMEESSIVQDLASRRRLKIERHEAHDLRMWTAAAVAACEGVPTDRLTPGLVKRLLEVN